MGVVKRDGIVIMVYYEKNIEKPRK